MIPLTNFAIAAGAILALGGALFGWGLVVRRRADLPPGTWPVTIGLGLALWIAIGGVLNLVRLAYPVVIFSLLIVGCALTAKQLTVAPHRNRFWPAAREDRLYTIAYLVFAVGIVGFSAITQFAPTAFNHHDDYQKYFAHVARMVQTGTLASSPLNTLGSETLGGQAFLQGPFIAALPIAYINASDAVFCFALTVFLIGGLALGRPSIGVTAIIGMLIVDFLEPQYVSVTALYSAAALVAVIVILSLDPREHAKDNVVTPPPIVIGLTYAAIVALKSTFALLVLLHFLCYSAAELFSTRNIAATAKRAAATGIWGIAFIAPWIALYGPLYWTALTHPFWGSTPAPTPANETLDLFAAVPLFYGGSYAQYTFIATVGLISGFTALVGYGQTPRDAARCVGVSVAVMATYLVMLIWVGPQLAGYETALRHVIPVLIGATPAILIYGCWISQAAGSSAKRQAASWVCAGMAAIIACWFAPGAWERASGLLHTGTMLAYIRNWSPESTDALLAASRDVLASTGEQPIRVFQQQVPAGEPLLVWIAAPFLLDYARNPIIDVDIGGLANPWARSPSVSYVLWQYGGFGVRQPSDYIRQTEGPGRRETYLAARGMAYANGLQNLATRSQIVDNDGMTVLFRVAPDAALP